MKPYVLALAVCAVVPSLHSSPPDEGMTRENALARYGLPQEIVVGANHMTYRYAGREGELYDVTFHEDLSVTQLATDKLGPLVQVPRRGPYLGQSVAHLIDELGPAETVTHGVHALELVFGADHRILVADGVVVGIEGS